MRREKIKVWDSSASKNVWSHPNEYFDWRMYTLDRLSDMGFLDHLIDDMGGETLREIDDVGLKTGIQVEVGQVARVGGRRTVTTPVPAGDGASDQARQSYRPFFWGGRKSPKLVKGKYVTKSVGSKERVLGLF